jgi:ABC-2 type transport system ATP-binding protein
MDSDTVIKIESISKYFRLPHEKATTLKSNFTGLFRHTKGFEKHRALKDVSFEVKKGEFFGVVGRNGSGKSTLLKILAGIYQPNAGSVKINGKLVPFIELGVGFNPELTGRENIYLNGAMLGFSPKQIDQMYEDIVSFAELERFMDQRLKNYSSGMQVRLAFSVAIRAQADILLVDEVLAVGDADFQRKCYEYFKTLKRNKQTVVFVSHDMAAVREYCDRVALIDMSKLVGIYNAETAAKKYMQLFAKEEQEQSTKQTKRWGNKKAAYKKVESELVDNGENILLSIEVEAKEDILDPTYGFKISNEANQPLLGTNTIIEQVKIKPLTGGQRITLKWKFPNIFNEGRYYVELALMHNVVEVADWWEDATSFSVRNEKRTPYTVNPPTEFWSE